MTDENYRNCLDFQRASKTVFLILKRDLDGKNRQRAIDAKTIYEFVALLLAYAKSCEDRAANRAFEIAKLRGQVELLVEKRVGP